MANWSVHGMCCANGRDRTGSQLPIANTFTYGILVWKSRNHHEYHLHIGDLSKYCTLQWRWPIPRIRRRAHIHILCISTHLPFHHTINGFTRPGQPCINTKYRGEREKKKWNTEFDKSGCVSFLSYRISLLLLLLNLCGPSRAPPGPAGFPRLAIKPPVASHTFHAGSPSLRPIGASALSALNP